MQQTIFTISVCAATFGYVAYMCLGESPGIRDFLSRNPEDNFRHVLFQRLTGVVFFGIIPLLLIAFTGHTRMANYGIIPSISGESLLWIGVLTLVIVPMNYYNSRKSDNLAMYPQVRNREWTTGLLIASALSWITYLLAYEMMFRGFLLFSSLEILGYWPAILLNTGIYSLAHYPKGNKEALGAIPLGFILCVLTIKTGSLWIAFLSHVVLALSNEWFSLKAHPSITLKKAEK